MARSVRIYPPTDPSKTWNKRYGWVLLHSMWSDADQPRTRLQEVDKTRAVSSYRALNERPLRRRDVVLQQLVVPAAQRKLHTKQNIKRQKKAGKFEFSLSCVTCTTEHQRRHDKPRLLPGGAT